MSSDLSQAYVREAPSAVEAVILKTAAEGATAACGDGCACIETTLVTVSVAAFVVVLAAAVLVSQTHRYCHPLNAY